MQQVSSTTGARSGLLFHPFFPSLLQKGWSKQQERVVPGHGCGKGDQSALPRRDRRHPSHAAHPRGRQPALPRAGSRERLGTRGLPGHVRSFPLWSRGKLRRAPGEPVAGALWPGGARCRARMNLSPAHNGCLRLRRLVRQQHPLASLSASLSRNLLGPPLQTFTTGGQRTTAPRKILFLCLTEHLLLDYRLLFAQGPGGL